MTIKDIETLIHNDETREIELKKTTGELKDGMKSACAFLNTDGGWLIFGVTPTTLRIVGQDVTESTRREIALALTHLEPALNIEVEYIDVPDSDGKQLIVMRFDKWVWGMEPYTYHKCPYYRVESVIKEMPRDMFVERLKAARPLDFAWDEQIAQGITINDLDEERIRNAVRLGIAGGRINASAEGATVETLLGKLKLLNDGKLTNAAVMLFGDNTVTIIFRRRNDSQSDSQNDSQKSLNERQKKIVMLMRNDQHISVGSIAVKLSLSAPTIYREIKKINTVSELYWDGSSKTGHWAGAVLDSQL